MKRAKVKPVCLIAGGPGTSSRTIQALFKKVFKIYGFDAPRIAYVGAASGDNSRFFGWLKEMLIAAGAGSVTLAPVARKVLRIEETRKVLGCADVEKGMQLLKKRRLIPVLKKLFINGIPFFGLSAGSIMLSKCWVRLLDPEDDTTAELFPCLGFAPVLCDTHGEDEDWGELRVLLKLTKNAVVGYGITSKAGLVVMPGGRIKTFGGPVHRLKN